MRQPLAWPRAGYRPVMSAVANLLRWVIGKPCDNPRPCKELVAQHAQTRAFLNIMVTLKPRAPLVARGDLARPYAELIDVPIADEHLDRGCR